MSLGSALGSPMKDLYRGPNLEEGTQIREKQQTEVTLLSKVG